MSSTLNSYTESLDNLTFSDEAKERMAARLEQAASNRQEAPETPQLTLVHGNRSASVPSVGESPVAAPSRTRKPSWLKVAAVAAGIVAALAGGGYGVAAAAGILPAPSEVLSDVFGDSPAQVAVIDKVGYPLDASSTSNGVTITARAVAGDSTGCTTVFDIEWDDEHPLDLSGAQIEGSDKLYLTWSRANNSFSIDGAASSVGASYFYDADPSDNSIQYVEQLDQVKPFFGDTIVGRTARLDFNELSLVTPDGLKPIATGDWSLKFQLNYEDSTVEMPAGQQTGLMGHEVTVQAIKVSATGITVDYDVSYVADYTDAEDGLQSEHDTAEANSIFGLPITVSFSDGTSESAEEGGGTSTDHDGYTSVSKSASFENIHSTGDITSITVGDVVIPMNQ